MKEENASSTLEVTDVETANVLTDPEHLRYIAPFLGRERTVSEVARETKSTLSTTYRRVKRYCDLGILEVAREHKRKGKPLKIYCTVADAFFVPLRLTGGPEERSARWQKHWERDFQRSFRHAYRDELETWGQRIYRKNGVFVSMMAKSPSEDLNTLTTEMPASFNRFHDSPLLRLRRGQSFPARTRGAF